MNFESKITIRYYVLRRYLTKSTEELTKDDLTMEAEVDDNRLCHSPMEEELQISIGQIIGSMFEQCGYERWMLYLKSK